MFVRHFPLTTLTRELGNLFEELDREAEGGRRGIVPPLDVWDGPDAYTIEADLPGLKLDDIDLTIEGRQLRLAAKRAVDTVEGDERGANLLRERRVGEFSRSLTLPTDIDADKVQAQFRDGVLTIRLPKSDSTRVRKIAVSAGAGQ